jgi:DNA polymerase III subunit delta'
LPRHRPFDNAFQMPATPPTPLLDAVLAQDTAVSTLRRALAGGRVHHAYLFDGPAGVGKELAAFGLAQALVCATRAEGGDRACGTCSACTRAVPREETTRPVHPDVVVLERGLYEPAQIGRRTPESQDISIDQVRSLVLARAAYGPHEGRAKVFILRRAEELSVPAANALLKTLEEPGQKTHFVLLTAQASLLLPTILSRTQRVRFGYLPEATVTVILGGRGVEPARAAEIARLAGGSVETALGLADPEESERRTAFVAQALRAIDAPDMGLALDLAEDAKKAKDALPLRIAALASALGVRGAAAVGARGQEGRDAGACAARYSLAISALGELDGNASAQLVVESMLARMRAV